MYSYFEEKIQIPLELNFSDMFGEEYFHFQTHSYSELQTIERDIILDEKPINFSDENSKSNYSYDTKNEIPYGKNLIHLGDGQLTGKSETLPETCKIDSDVSEEKPELTKGTIDYKPNSFDCVDKDFEKIRKESSVFFPLIAAEALSDVGSQACLGKKTKRNGGKTKNSDQLKTKKSVSEACAIRKETSTNPTYIRGFENTEIEEMIGRLPSLEINYSMSTLTDNSFTNYNYKDDYGNECLEKSSDLFGSLNKEKKKNVIFRIFKAKKHFEYKLQEASTASNSINLAHPPKQAALRNQSKKEKTQKSEGTRKMSIDSINKKIKTHFFKYLIQKFGVSHLFSQIFITDTDIERNKLLMEKSIGEVIYERLLEKNNFEVKIAEIQLAEIIENLGFKKDKFTSKLNDLYELEYFHSKECNKKLAQVFEKESEIYANKYEFRLNNFVKYFREEKGNNKNEKNKGKKRDKK